MIILWKLPVRTTASFADSDYAYKIFILTFFWRGAGAFPLLFFQRLLLIIHPYISIRGQQTLITKWPNILFYFFHSIVQICLSSVPPFPLWHAWKEQFASQIAFCAMDSRARGLHLTWLSSVARPTNCLCDWRTDLWISPAFPVGCPGSPQTWLRMLTARLHRDGRDLSLSDRCSGGPSPGPRWWQNCGIGGGGGGGGGSLPHPITLSQHGNTHCQSDPPTF